MKVVLINPRMINNYSHPLGILYIAAVLEREGHAVKIIDPSLKDPIENITKSVLKEKPDVIGITAVTLEFNKALAIAKQLKASTDTPIILGGVHATILPKDTAKNECFDYVVVGEGEITVCELLNVIKNKAQLKNSSDLEHSYFEELQKIKGVIYKKNGKSIFTGLRPLIENIDSLPFPARHLLPEKAYFAPPKMRAYWTNCIANVMVARGCPHGCIFCSSHLMFGRKVRLRSPEKVVEEIKQLRLRFHVDSLRFDDDTFCINPEWTLKLCRLLSDLRKEMNWKDLKWSCNTRVDTITSELLFEMKKAGCKEIDFGIESGSSRVLKILKKGITIPQIIKAFDLTKKYNILTGATFIIGTPGETEDDLRLTERIVKRIKPDAADFYFACPFPETELYKLASQLGVFNKEDVPFNEWLFNKNTDRPIMSVTIPEERLIYWRSRLHNINLWRNYSHFISDPKFIIGGFKIFILGYKGIIPGFKRFIRTKKIDSLLIEPLHYYRLRLKKVLL